MLLLADVPAFAGSRLARMPWTLRILLENTLRNAPHDVRMSEALVRWTDTGTSHDEISFVPHRILMHDTTCVPALVDIAAMRDALHEAGGDARQLSPTLSVDVSVDHSLAVDDYGGAGSLTTNMERELQRNRERYRFLKWATRSFHAVTVHPPGTGIMHTLNLERLATVVATKHRDGGHWAIPDTLVGTDSHTPMVNGIGVLGWGVGGLEAESVMLGMPLTLRIPDVIGVRLVGRLREGVLATDAALAVTQILRARGTSGEFVEFFGPGVTNLSAGERSVIANMAPEYGASTGYFPIDEATIAYLRQTGRSPTSIDVVRRFANAQGLWFDPTCEPRYTDVVAVDLSALTISMAGPLRPQDRIDPGQTSVVIRSLLPSRTHAADAGDVPPDGAVAIAAITSCTNTTEPRLIIAAALVARRARQLNLRPAPWVKTSFAPGSPTASRYLSRAGLLEDLEAIGFHVVGYGCTTCIGNSGALAAPMQAAVERDRTYPVAVLSGNRNFPGRVHPQIEAAFLASPPLVIAFALAGTVNLDIVNDPIGHGPQGEAVRLVDLWPTGDEIDASLAVALDSSDYQLTYDEAEASEAWRALDAPDAPRYDWQPGSTYLRRPPFASARAPITLGRYVAHPLLVVGDDITTDHISPAGQIVRGSDAAAWLIANGADPDDLNVYASRRGNWEVMLRGMFANRSVRNLLDPEIPAGSTVHAPSGETLSIWTAARRYHAESEPVVLVAGARYGTGSSRDWAAKGIALLGVRAVLAVSFERIHRSNLIGMGILPLQLGDDRHPQHLKLRVGDLLEVDSEQIAPRCPIRITIVRSSGDRDSFVAHAAIETSAEVEILRNGGIIPHMLKTFTTSCAGFR